ncbi:unnamed protein product [Toxocara canis]|uniref:Secreted protein n=1 Tax=Toxocara canis TaxID=6265 RepID=A0A183UKX6_TOXCA|nr:unnamed protein product [Toxocara canis]
MALPNVSLSVFLTQQFRECAAALNLRFALPTSREGLRPLQVIKENIAREVEGSAGASVTVPVRLAHFPRRPLLAFGRGHCNDQGRILREVGGSAGASVTVAIWSGGSAGASVTVDI